MKGGPNEKNSHSSTRTWRASVQTSRQTPKRQPPAPLPRARHPKPTGPAANGSGRKTDPARRSRASSSTHGSMELARNACPRLRWGLLMGHQAGDHCMMSLPLVADRRNLKGGDSWLATSARRERMKAEMHIVTAAHSADDSTRGPWNSTPSPRTLVFSLERRPPGLQRAGRPVVFHAAYQVAPDVASGDGGCAAGRSASAPSRPAL